MSHLSVATDADEMAVSNVAPFSLANNQFSIDLYKNLIASKPSEENGFLSPFSVLAALSMINVGARGNTREQILTSTKLKNIGDSKAIDNAVKSLLSTLDIKTQPETTNQMNEEEDQWKRQTPYLAIANRVYIQKGFNVKPEFGRTLNTSYNTTFGVADFAKNAEGAKNEINQWVESVTNNRIKNLFGSMESSVKLALVSAIYFKAEWEDHFPERNTEQGDFFGADGKTIKVPFMKYQDEDAKFATFTDAGATGLLKSYANREMHMLVILPNKKDGLSALEKKLTPALFDVGQYKTADVTITLPKFKIEDDFKLNTGLQQIGIVDAFSDSSADFGGISDSGLMIGEAVHKAFVEVNEKGTEAAAATGLKVSPMSAVFFPEDMKKVFKAHHPFLFAIQHRETGAVLFIGRVSHPKAE